MYTVLVGETIKIPAREVTKDLMSAKKDWARNHNNPDAYPGHLQLGAKAKILQACARNPRNDVPVADVQYDDGEVRVTGCARGFIMVDIIDELSAPGGTGGLYGGHEVLVEDELDRAAANGHYPVTAGGISLAEPAPEQAVTE